MSSLEILSNVLLTQINIYGERERERESFFSSFSIRWLSLVKLTHWKTIMMGVYLGFIQRQSLSAWANEIKPSVLWGPIGAVHRIRATINLLGDRGFVKNGGLRSINIQYEKYNPDAKERLNAFSSNTQALYTIGALLHCNYTIMCSTIH